MKRALLLTASLLFCANSAAQTPSDAELADIFTRNVTLATAGDNAAQMSVCAAFTYGLGTAANPEQALPFCLHAAKAGVPRAQLLLADSYLQGIGTAIDVSAAGYWYTRAIAAGLSQGHVGLAAIYLDIDNTFETRNLELAALHAEQAASAGLHMGEMYLGVIHFNGFDSEATEATDIDYASATLWFEKSAQQGNMIAAAYLVSIYASETEYQDSYKAYFWASVLKRHLPEVYPKEAHQEFETRLDAAQRDAVAQELLLMEQSWKQLLLATAPA